MFSSLFRRLLVAATVVLVSCTAVGPTRVEPDGPFDGIGQLLTPLTESVNVLMVHGMGAEKNQEPKELILRISSRLQLEEVESIPAMTLLENDPPPYMLGDEKLWESAESWNRDAPTLRILRYKQKETNLRINFYLFDYWKALARIKCAYLVQSDTRLIGATDISGVCEDLWEESQRGTLTIHEPLGAQPAYVNRYFKSGIVEWGLADAVIATSDFRRVLRKALGEAMTKQQEDLARQRAINFPQAPARTFGDLLSHIQQPGSPKFAIITHSLGSYVVFDALANANAGGKESILCVARQVHMLANQLPLLQFSEIATEDEPARSVEASAAENCNNIIAQAQISAEHGPLPKVQVVAYHEPNDLLTFYINDLDGSRFSLTNVVASFTKVWIPYLAADPMTAHTGQYRDRTIMDMVANGYH